MVIQKTIENLRERPKEERKAVALAVSFFVVVVLFLGWAIFFFQSIQSSNTTQVVETGFTSRVIEAKNTFETPAQSQVTSAPVSSTTSPDAQGFQMIEETGQGVPAQ